MSEEREDRDGREDPAHAEQEGLLPVGTDDPAGHAHEGPVGSLLGAHEEHLAEEPPSEPRPRRVRSAASCLIVLLVIAAIGGGAAYGLYLGADRIQGLFAGPEDYSGEGEGNVLFEVQEGDTAAQIGRNLKEAGVVASVDAFTEAATAEPDSSGIQVGFYELRERMSAQAALDVLIEPENLIQAQVTIPEGLRVEDTIKRLAKNTDIPLREFRRALDKPDRIGLPPYAGGNAEGYLFPATYAIRPDASAVDVLSQLVDRWEQAAEAADLEDAAERLGYTPGELMIVASLVEAEVNRDDDRGKVARVIYNRLETDATNGLLQIDATVNYALGRDLGLALTTEDLQVDSPYNTRRYPGLPPGPIESPGDDAIAAAANPAKGPWVYYVTVNLDTGETKFAEDYDDFLTYKRELERWCEGSDRC